MHRLTPLHTGRVAIDEHAMPFVDVYALWHRTTRPGFFARLVEPLCWILAIALLAAMFLAPMWWRA